MLRFKRRVESIGCNCECCEQRVANSLEDEPTMRTDRLV
jgi:hypothetical protein